MKSELLLKCIMNMCFQVNPSCDWTEKHSV